MELVSGPEAVTKNLWQELGQGRLTPRIREEILRVIRDRELTPGDRLPSERELAELLRVSRPSVREALKSLETEGRLDVVHGRGVFVAEPATRRRLRESLARIEHDLSELFLMREVLEVPAARWAAEQQDVKALAAVRHSYDALEKAWRQNPVDYDELQVLDAAFHLCIVRASGNRFMEQAQGVLNDMLCQGMRTTLQVPGRARRSRTDHRRILDALLASDGAAAARAARSHVRDAHKAALTATQVSATEA